jgi:hypothetical protein
VFGKPILSSWQRREVASKPRARTLCGRSLRLEPLECRQVLSATLGNALLAEAPSFVVTTNLDVVDS